MLLSALASALTENTVTRLFVVALETVKGEDLFPTTKLDERILQVLIDALKGDDAAAA